MGTKIFVFKLKTLIKYGLVILAAFICAAVLISLLFKGSSKPTYSPGTYSADIVLHSQPVSVQVTVSKHSIDNVEMLNMQETEDVFYPMFLRSFDSIAEQVVENQGTDTVQIDDDSAVTGGIILQAVDSALEQAVK